jgi:hypothetical protein
MKLSDLSAKLTCMKGKAVRVLAASALAGAVLSAAAPAAQAQQIAFGVQFGGPRYYAPPPPPVRVYDYGYYRGYPAYTRPYGYSDWRYHNYVRHEEFERYRYDRNHAYRR